jgi:exosortase
MSGSGRHRQTSEEGGGNLGEVFTLPLPIRTLVFASFGFLLIMYVFYPAFPTTEGKTLAGWTWYACNAKANFLHGRFVPIAFGVMIWLAWKETKNEILKPSYWGGVILFLGLIFYVVAVRTIQPRMALIGMPFVVIGFTYFLCGFGIARHVIFPAFFLWFSIPVPGLEAVLTGNLQTLITRSCYHVGLFVGMDLTSSGATISISGSSVEIAEGCSGIRSLMALTMIAAVYSHYTQKPLWKKAILFTSSLPLAIIGNFFRIFTILVLTQLGFGEFAKKTYHDWAGLLLFFPITLAGLYLFDYLLNRKTRKRKVKRSVARTRNLEKETMSK